MYVEENILKVTTKEPMKPIVTHKFMEDRPICIFRTTDLVGNKVHRAPVKNPLSIFGRIRNILQKFFV